MIAAKRVLALLGVLALLLGGWRTAHAAPPQAISYQDVLNLLRARTDEAEIRRQLEQSPTQFTLDAQQIAELKRAGASDRLVDYLQQNRNPVTRGSDISDFVVILDCSGSMQDRTPDGVSKMDAAKRVVSEFIRDIPNGRRLAFIVYGHKLYGQDKAKGCQAVEVLMPLQPLDERLKGQVTQAISQLQPLGWTPIATALQTAGTELAKSKAMCQLILITDGMETCGGDPARVAEELNEKMNLPGGIDIIGFGVVPEEKAAVDKLAKATKGTYNTPEKANELGEAIKKARAEAEKKARAKIGGGNPLPGRPVEAGRPRPEPRQGGGTGERMTWRFENGHFENTSGNTWTEKRGDATTTWTEVRRTEDFVELTREDKGKERSVRLYDDHATHKAGKAGSWEKLLTGKWDK
jgi:Mg-chelatase subunit ChlD